MKQVQTTRFGTVLYGEDHLITFPDGMVGFSQLKTYVLVESPQNPLILWLQSTDHAEIAFPLVEPWFFRTDYKANLMDADKITLSKDEKDLLKVLVVVTIPTEMQKMTVNLKAPVIINIEKARATQIILQERSYEVRTPAFDAFSKALAQLGENHVTQSTPVSATTNVADDVWTAVNVKRTVSQSAATSAEF